MIFDCLGFDCTGLLRFRPIRPDGPRLSSEAFINVPSSSGQTVRKDRVSILRIGLTKPIATSLPAGQGKRWRCASCNTFLRIGFDGMRSRAGDDELDFQDAPFQFPDNPSCWFRHIPSGAVRPSDRWCTCHRSICDHADHQTASLPTLHKGGSTTDDKTRGRSCGRRVAPRNMQPERHVISGRAIGPDLVADVDLWGRPRIFLFALV